MLRTIILIGFVTLSLRAFGDIPTVPHVELGRYAGVWYEIARIPQPSEAGCRCVQAEYTVRSEEQLGVVNTCRRDGAVTQARGTATVVERSAGSKLSVQIPPHRAGEYWIVALDSNYGHAM